MTSTFIEFAAENMSSRELAAAVARHLRANGHSNTEVAAEIAFILAWV